MNLNQPQPSTALPDDLQKAIDNARVNLANLESKYIILNNQNGSLQKENNSLIKNNDYLGEQIASKEKLIKTIDQQIEDKNKDLGIVSDELQILRKEISHKIADGEEVDKIHKDRELTVYTAEQASKEMLKKLEDRELKLKSEEEQWAKRVESLKGVISQF